MYTASDQSAGGDKGVCVEGLRNGCKVEKGVSGGCRGLT